MKIILAGATGFIGSEVLGQALTHPSITSIIVLSRRPLTQKSFDDSKVEVVVVEDFEKGYTKEVLEKLEGAVGCCWCLGAKINDLENFRRVSIVYPLAAAKAFSSLGNEGNFRFVYLSGFVTVRDQDRSLWVLGAARKIGGEAEMALLDFAGSGEEFETVILRPAGVRPRSSIVVPDYFGGAGFNVRVEELAAVLLDSAMGGAGMGTVENGEIVRRGRQILEEVRE